MEEYGVLYSYTQEELDLSFTYGGLFLTLIFLLAYIGVKFFPNTKILYYTSPKLSKIILLGGLIFGTVWSSIAAFTQLSGFYSVNDRIENGAYHVVHGLTRNYHPMPSGGHDMESFYVDSVFFEYSDFSVTEGYSHACSRGGYICSDSMDVRISYIPMYGGNVIIKLELKTSN